MTALAYRPRLDGTPSLACKLKQNANDGCNSCATLAGLVLCTVPLHVLLLAHSKNELMQWRGVRRLSDPSVNICANRFFSRANGRIATKLAQDGLHSRSACIQGVLKVKVKGHVIRALSWILGMSYSVIDGLVLLVIAPLGTLDGRLYESAAARPGWTVRPLDRPTERHQGRGAARFLAGFIAATRKLLVIHTQLLSELW